MRKCFFDTESVQYQGPTILIQYQFDDEPIVLHNIFKETAKDTLDLIDEMMECEVIGFNLVHDMFHLARTYNILRFLDSDRVVVPTKYFEVEKVYGNPDRPINGEPSIYDICLKPAKALDLMILGRESIFQQTMDRKPIVIKRFPKMLAPNLLFELEKRLDLPPILFTKNGGKPDWRIEELLDNGYTATTENKKKFPIAKINPDIVNVKLVFTPATGLKAITKYILKKDVLEYETSIKKIQEKPYAPILADYASVIDAHIEMWSSDARQLKYATDDVINTKAVYEYLKGEAYQDTNHNLAVLVGNSYWSGYSIDRTLVKKLLIVATKKRIEYSKEIEYNSPAKCLEWLRDSASPLMAKLLESTDKLTLEKLITRDDELGRRANIIFKGRRIDKEVNLLQKLDEAGRFHASFNIVGTRSNRMSGGSLVKTSGSINPQGISKKDLAIRECFTFKDHNQILEGGDFAGFEVAIAEAVFKDKRLREQLLTGKKFHAIFGSMMYGMDYEAILADEEKYGKAKSGVFGFFYGAQPPKIAETLGLDVDEVTKGFNKMEKTYTGMAESKAKIQEDFQAMSQPKGIGTAVVWKTPADYIESFLGFRRYFTSDYGIIKALFDLSTDLPDDFKIKNARVQRNKDKTQTVEGACRSALYAGAFSLQSSILRVCSNHVIQSPGGQMTKEMQERMFALQPFGATKWKIKIFNVHDELVVAVVPEMSHKVSEIKDKYIKYRKNIVPLLEMDWATGENWREIH